jgi:cytochrome c peroxidase
MTTRVPLLLILGLASLAGCYSDVTTPEPPQPTIDAQLRASIGSWGIVPIGAMPAQNAAQVALGRALFFDKILSGNRDVACATCHDVSTGLGDGRSLSVGTGGTGTGVARRLGAGRQFTTRSAPSLLNAGLGLYTMFWDLRLTGGQGHFVTDPNVPFPAGLPNILTAQAMLPVLSRHEMRGAPGDVDVFGNPNELALLGDQQPAEVWSAIMQRLLAVSEYMAMFNAAFPGAGQHRFEHAARALAVFQMEAFTRTRSPFDRYLERDDAVLTLVQKRGGLLFFGKAQCSSCHNGPFLGGQSLANVGAPQIGPGGTKQPPLDLGRGEHDNNDFYRFAFRVAPLRNVELTDPYFHSGAFRTLEAVVRHYNDVSKSLSEYDPSQLDPDVRSMYRGDPATASAVLATLDGRLNRPLGLTDTEIGELVAFLKALTDPAARNLSSVVPASVPSGLSVRE